MKNLELFHFDSAPAPTPPEPPDLLRANGRVDVTRVGTSLYVLNFGA